MSNSTKYLLISVVTFVAGYMYLRLAYNATSEIPFVQEVVLKSYNNFLKVVKKTAKDRQINALESDELSEELARLCSDIRYDLMPKGENKVDEVKKTILGNIRKINE